MWACERSMLSIASDLLARNADANVAAVDGMDAIDIYLPEHPRTAFGGILGMSVLMYACAGLGADAPEIVPLLLAAGKSAKMLEIDRAGALTLVL